MTEMIQLKITSYFIKITYIICLLRTRVYAESCQITVRDPEWNRQWYMREQYMNVMPAWRQCFNGTGVTVAVVDIGVQNHRDLTINRSLNFKFNSSNNFRQRYSYNYNYRYRYRNRYRTNFLKHGTRIAGLIAAKQNDIDISGIAFGAEIADIRIASTSMFENFDPSALIHKKEQIDIYSCSFGNIHTGLNVYPLKDDVKRVLQHGVDFGRSRKGSIYVIGTGNSGDVTDLFQDSCAYDGFMNNRYVIPVAGIRRDFSEVPNGEMCSSILVSAFTSKAGERIDRNKLVTLDINNGTTTYLVDNSAAVPMISGAIALALSANPALSYRDVMHLLVQTSRNTKNGSFNSFFQQNGGQFRYSQKFGFGFVDVGHLVTKSRTWRNVPEHKECIQEETIPKSIVGTSHNLLVTSCEVTYTEHVEITLEINDSEAGQLTLYLHSPVGTRSKILPGRKFDSRNNLTISVVTVQMWGENPRGHWILSAENTYGNQIDGDILSWKLKLHGFTCVDGESTVCSQPVNEEDFSTWSSWGSCSVSCGSGYKERSRTCYNTVSCNGTSKETRGCYVGRCPVTTTSSIPTGGMFECLKCQFWRFRYCTSEYLLQCLKYQKRRFMDGPREEWTRWTSWSNCSRPCGGGSKSRTRQCYKYNQLSSPLMCSGEGKQYSLCNVDLCPEYSTWSDWSTCSVTCGAGIQIRQRQCNRAPCREQLINKRQCSTQVCPEYSTWSDWSTCSVTCGTGIQTRQRQCNRASCRGQLKNKRQCSTRVCPERRMWSKWSQCSNACGPGSRSREMLCNGGRCSTSHVQIGKCYLQHCSTDCRDRHWYCLPWKENGYCNKPWAKDSCKSTCNFC